MEKDYLPSEKYTQDEIDQAAIPYSLQDSCVDPLVDFRSCTANSRWNFLPMFHKLGPCN